ncbi:glycosyltransferase [Photobacterium sp. SDRW27]|uniref:glycosyltransferase family 2 protein n=1 Tax=Photobacterium obscurum TaxID=2829490 RepID=UPI002243466C|nr:glycosyltransferase family 2 protein [Photobacterium obscurum]MCW8328235.1 glycosyltransferase [Photobacterium obscurum]
MNKQHLISIITPSYKSKRFIQETIDSVASQSYDNFEMLIVDDCSPDGSADFISSILPDARFKLIRLAENVGAAEARNVALKHAKGKFIAFLDADDLWMPDKLAKQIAFMKAKDIAFSYTSYDLIDQGGNDLNKTIRVPESISAHDYMKNTIIGCLTVIIDREKVKDFIMPNLKSSHDMALWIDIMQDNNVLAYGIDEILSRYRLVSTSNTANKFKAAKDVWKVYRDYLEINFFKSSWLFLNYAINATIKRI